MVNVKNWGGGGAPGLNDIWKCACTCACSCICGCGIGDDLDDCVAEAYLGDDYYVTTSNWYGNKTTGY